MVVSTSPLSTRGWDGPMTRFATCAARSISIQPMRRRSGASARGCSIRIRSRAPSARSTARPKSTRRIVPAGSGSRGCICSADEHDRAAGLLERLASADPSDGYTLQLLGTAYRRLGRHDQAASALQVGAKGEPQWSDPWTNEMLAFRRGYAALLKDATAYIVAGQFPRRSRILEQLRRDRPDDLVLMAHLGQVYVAAGRDTEGVAAARTRRGRGSRIASKRTSIWPPATCIRAIFRRRAPPPSARCRSMRSYAPGA